MNALTIRHLLIDMKPPLVRHWNGGEVFLSAFFDALSMSFPVGEQFFIDSLREGMAQLPADQKPAWAREIQGFVGQEAIPVGAKFWKDNTKAPTGLKKSDAVNLTDAIAILKMIVGLNVNSNNTPLSPSQAIAADFDQSGDVGLTDAIGVLKMVVGLTAPSPTWKYYDETKLTSAYSASESLNPKAWTSTAVISDTDTVASSVKLIGVLTGDVDGSWTGV